VFVLLCAAIHLPSAHSILPVAKALFTHLLSSILEASCSCRSKRWHGQAGSTPPTSRTPHSPVSHRRNMCNILVSQVKPSARTSAPISNAWRSGIGKAGADLLHAAHSAASGAMSAVKTSEGFHSEMIMGLKEPHLRPRLRPNHTMPNAASVRAFGRRRIGLCHRAATSIAQGNTCSLRPRGVGRLDSPVVDSWSRAAQSRWLPHEDHRGEQGLPARCPATSCSGFANVRSGCRKRGSFRRGVPAGRRRAGRGHLPPQLLGRDG